MEKKRIIGISHAFIKKINLSFFEKLSEDNNIQITCIAPKFLYLSDNYMQGKKKCYPDYDIKNINLDLRLLMLKFKHMRFFYFYNIKKIIKEIKPHLIILDNDTATVQSIILIIYSFFYKFKISYFCNENNIRNIINKFTFKKLVKLTLLYLINSCIKWKVYKIFCFTKEIKKNYDFLGYKNKTVVMPLGYNEKIFKIHDNKVNNKFIISFFGRMLPAKGVHTLLKSLENLKFDNWILMLDTFHLADRNYFRELKPQLKKLLKKNKLKLIKCNYFEIAKFMSMSDLVVLPSEIEEQYGRIIQETVASGTLVIGSNIGAFREIIDDDELLFNPGNFAQLSEVINKIYFDKNFRDIKFNNLYNKISPYRSISNQVNILKNYI